MKSILAFVLMSCLGLHAQESENNILHICQDIQIEKQPFYISDEYRQGDKIWENLRNIDNQNLKDQYIPRGSIVYTPPEFVEKMNESTQRIPVKVLSIPSKENEDNIRNSKKRSYNSISSMASTGSLKRVEAFSVGWIDKKSVRKASDYTFMVTKDSPLYRSPGKKVINDNYISLSVTNGKYDVKRCCTPDTYQGEEYCFDQYKFLVIDKDNNKLDELFIKENMMECQFIRNLAPVANRIVEPIKSILGVLRVENPEMAIDELEMLPTYNTWYSGTPKISRKEMVKFRLDTETGEGPFGSMHYRADDKVNSDAYLKPNSHCSLLQVMKKHKEDCKGAGCQIQFGDMYHHDNWGAHSGHDSGECIDIRPFRKSDDDNAGLTYRHGRYDHEKTRKFIQLLKDAGARSTIFNDRKISGISRDSSGVHNDHIHVCFGENVSKVQETCKSGL